MSKPVILAVDDEPGVLGAVDRDLRRHYGSSSRCVQAPVVKRSMRSSSKLRGDLLPSSL